MSAPSPAAARARRYRERRLCGIRIVPVEIDIDLLETLEHLGLVNRDEVGNPEALAFALSMLIAETVEARRSQFNLNSSRVTRCSKAVVESGQFEKRSRK